MGFDTPDYTRTRRENDTPDERWHTGIRNCAVKLYAVAGVRLRTIHSAISRFGTHHNHETIM